MPLILNKETGKYEPITRVEDMTEISWAGVVSCGGNKKMLDKYYKKCGERKQKILDVMKKEGKTTVKEYMEVRNRLFFS